MLPDLNRLKVFYYIYIENSIVRAANRLHLTQPAVSQQLQKLERELKVQLFSRLHKKLVPTLAADQLFAFVEPFISNLKNELLCLRQPYEHPAGLLRIGAPREFGKEHLPRFCASFRKQYPDVTFHLKFEEPTPLLTMIKEGILDYALVDVYFKKKENSHFSKLFSIDPLLTERMLLVCSRDYYEREIRGDHSLKNLIGKDFITDEDDPSTLEVWFNHHFRKGADNLNTVLTIDNHQALVSSLKLGMGLGVAAAHLIWNEIRRKELIPVTTEQGYLVNMISLVQLQDKRPTLTEKTFRDFLLAEVRKEEVLKKFRAVESDGDK